MLNRLSQGRVLNVYLRRDEHCGDQGLLGFRASVPREWPEPGGERPSRGRRCRPGRGRMAERRQLVRGKKEPRNPGPLPADATAAPAIRAGRRRPRSVTGKKSSGVQALILQRTVSCTWPAGHLIMYLHIAVSTPAFLSCSVAGTVPHIGVNTQREKPLTRKVQRRIKLNGNCPPPSSP